MTPEDLARIHEAAMPGQGWSPKAMADLMAEGAVFADACPHSFALGRVVLDEAELLMLATEPDHQRKGHAQERLRNFESLARKRGAKRAFLEVATGNGAAIALYSRAGWSKEGMRRGYYRRADGAREDALILAKNLTIR